MARLKGEIEAEKRKAALQPNQQKEIDSLKSQLAKANQERDEVFNNLARAEEYIEKKEEELRVLNAKVQQPEVKSTELVQALANVRNLDQELVKAKSALNDRTVQFNQSEAEVQRLKRELDNQKAQTLNAKTLESEVARLKSEIENERKKATLGPNQQKEIDDLKSQLAKVSQEKDEVFSNLARAEEYIERQKIDLDKLSGAESHIALLEQQLRLALARPTENATDSLVKELRDIKEKISELSAKLDSKSEEVRRLNG